MPETRTKMKYGVLAINHNTTMGHLTDAADMGREMKPLPVT